MNIWHKIVSGKDLEELCSEVLFQIKDPRSKEVRDETSRGGIFFKNKEIVDEKGAKYSSPNSYSISFGSGLLGSERSPDTTRGS